MNKRTLLVLVAALFWLAMGCGCVALAPAIDSFQKAGLMEGDRVRLLSEDLKKFHDARFWGDPNQALSFCTAESRSSVVKIFKKNRDQERIVDHRIDDVEFESNAFKAKVEVTIRAFQVPFYVVKNKTEVQHWEFGLAGGWKIIDIEEIEEKPPARGRK